jgi:TorA maturation chaperone TorD
MSGSTVAFDLSLNMARQSLYRFAGLSLLDPRAGAWDRLCVVRQDALLFEAAALFREAAVEQSTPAGTSADSIDRVDPQLVLAHLPSSTAALNAEYESTFGLLVSSNCPPYEMEYVNSKFTFQRSNTLADISGFYQAFGMTGSETNPERPDHIVLELEFMATLLGLERGVTGLDSVTAVERQQVCRNAQSRFLQEHLAWWVPAFSMLLAKQNGDGFYAAAGQFVDALVAGEQQLLGLPPTSMRVAPTSEERPEFCEGCELSG